MTDYVRIIEFYTTVSSRTDDNFYAFGQHMLELVRLLQTELSNGNIEVSTAMYNLILWNDDSSGRHLHVGWEDGSYLLSVDAFESIEYMATKNEVLSYVQKYLKHVS